MHKNIWIILGVLLVFGCSQKASNSTKNETPQASENIVPKDFVPEHIRLSHIEVVPHN